MESRTYVVTSESNVWWTLRVKKALEAVGMNVLMEHVYKGPGLTNYWQTLVRIEDARRAGRIAQQVF